MAQEIYDLQVTASPLPSERDQNFLLQTQSGERFVLKIANALEERPMLEAQQQAMMHLAQHTSLCPRVVPTHSGEVMAEVQAPSGASHLVRLVTYLPGVPFGSLRRHSPELLCDLGRSLGRLDRALASFDHPAIHRNFHWDLANGLGVVRDYAGLIADTQMRELVNQLAADFERHVAPLLPELRTSVIHNDANDFNVIVGGGNDLYTRNQSVVGLIDFGDMVHSYTVGDLAVAIAYAVLDKPDPLAAAAHIVRGYHQEFTIIDNEIAALFGLVRLRLCMSVCMAAHQQRQRPDDDYLAISQQPIRHTLPKLAQIHPRLAEAVFRHACGLSPVPSSEAVTDWLLANAGMFAPIRGGRPAHIPVPRL